MASAAVAVFLILHWYLVVRPLPPKLSGYWSGLYITSRSLSRFALQFGTDIRGLMAGIAPLPPLATLAILAAIVAFMLWRRQWTVVAITIGPVAIAAGLSALSIAPLGTGRTDAYLYPGLALIAALAIGRMPAPVLISTALCLTLAAGLAVDPPVGYPVAHVRQAQSLISAHIRPGDQVIVSSFSLFGWALLSPVPPEFTVTRTAINAYSLTSRVRHVTLLAPGSAVNGVPTSARPTCPNASRVWWVGPNDPHEKVLAMCGFVRKSRGATDLWVRPNA
jgi:hypothetical protein